MSAASDNTEFIHEFVAESREHLDAGEGCLLRLSKNAQDEDAVQACFRSLHTVKGGAGFMGLERIQHLAHAAEQLLDAVREKRAEANAQICDILLASVSRLRELIEAAEAQTAVDGDDQSLIDRLKALLPPSEGDDYAPSASSADQQRAPVATSRRVAKTAPSPPQPSLDQIMGDLISIDPADTAALRRCLDTLQALCTAEAWPATAQTHLDSMGSALADLAEPASRAQAHSFLLAIAEQLMQSVVSSRVRKASRPVIAALQSDSAGGPPATVPDAPSILDFLSEMTELLGRAEAVLLASASPDAGQIEELFRSFHTVKGMASYLGHPRIEQLAHALESRFMAARDGKEAFSPSHHQLALAGIDGLRLLGADLRRSGSDNGPWPRASASLARSLGLDIPGDGPGVSSEIELPPEVPRIGDLLVQTGHITRQQVEAAVATLKPGERLGEKLVESGKIKREVVDQAVAKQADLAAKAQGEGFARVSINRLEELVNLVGEMLIAQAMVSQEPEVLQSPRLGIVVGRQARVVRDLQALALSLRLVPLRATFQKMARAVHDTARKLNKQVEFQLIGEDVEVDRTLVEAIADPLLHMVRNAVDHGIEGKDARAAAGKPAAGTVRLSAAHSGDHVTVTLTDDGKGLDPAKLVAKAKEKGLIAADAVLSDSEAFNLIFLPGFSTAEQVTAVSGRGVGMDVVKRNLERVKGKVEISSTLGKGSVFTISLPLTTAILDAMVLRVGTERFLVPVTAIIEALRPTAGQVAEVLGRGRVIEARGQLVPVVLLGELFGVDGAEIDPTRSVLLVIERDGGTLAVQVDEILGMQQVVIKPLDRDAPHHSGIAGAAIMGDGRVGLIIDPAHLLAA